MSESYLNLGRHELKCPHGERHDDIWSISAVQYTNERHNSQPLALDDGPGDTMSPENMSPSTAVNQQIAVEQVNEGGKPKIPCVVTEFLEALLRPAKIGARGEASQLIKLLHDQTFDSDIFTMIIRI